MKKLTLILLLFSLIGCVPSPTQIVTPTATNPPPTATEALVPTATTEPLPTATATLPAPTTYTVEQLSKMSKAEIIALAPTLDSIVAPEGESWKVVEQRVYHDSFAVVYYDEDGRQRKAFNPETGSMYDGVSVYKYDKDLPALVTYFRNDESLENIPNEYFVAGNEDRLAEAMLSVLAINWAYPRLANFQMFDGNINGLGLVVNQKKYYDNTILPAFVSALKDGSVWSEGKKGILVEGKLIKDEIPTFVVERGRDDKKAALGGNNNNDPYTWTEVEYSDNQYVVSLYPPKKFYDDIMPRTIGGIFSSLRGLIPNDIGVEASGAPRDFSKIISMILLNISKIGIPMKDPTSGERNPESNFPSLYRNLPESYYEVMLGQ